MRRVLGLLFPEADGETTAEDGFASLSKYAANAGDAGDDPSLEGMRGSIARDRARGYKF